MLYYSELLKDTFETPEACEAAEKEFEEKENERKEKEAEQKTALSKKKKELANCVEESEEALKRAYEDLEQCKDECRAIRERCVQKIKEKMDEAREAVRTAEKNRFDAVSQFNKEFGAYTKVLSNDEIRQELQRSVNWINDLFNGFFF